VFACCRTNQVVSFASWTTKLAGYLRRTTTQWWRLSPNNGEIILHSSSKTLIDLRLDSPLSPSITVSYSPEGFLNKNVDALNPDFVSLLRGSAVDTPGTEGLGSVNPFIKGLFSAKVIAIQAHPRDEDTIVAA